LHLDSYSLRPKHVASDKTDINSVLIGSLHFLFTTVVLHKFLIKWSNNLRYVSFLIAVDVNVFYFHIHLVVKVKRPLSYTAVSGLCGFTHRSLNVKFLTTFSWNFSTNIGIIVFAATDSYICYTTWNVIRRFLNRSILW
jgi:hypothetical protein